MEFWLGVGMLVTLFVGGMIFLYRYEMSKIEIVPMSDDEKQALDWAVMCMTRRTQTAPPLYVEIIAAWSEMAEKEEEDGE